MTNKKDFTKNELWNMDTDTFTKLFFSKNVRVSFGDGHVETGFVEEIGLAANLDASSGEHLPVCIKVNSHTVSIAIIRKIEII